MKLTLIAASLAGLLAAGLAQAELDLNDDKQKLSYGLGLMIGERVTKRYGDIDFDTLLEGIRAQHSGGETAMSLEDAQVALQAYEQQAAASASAAAIAAGKNYLAENRAKEGVTETESGLQYEVITAADGAKPAATDRVSVHYKGTLLDGTEFDSSYSRGEPAEFALNGVIPGWTEGLQLMNVGSKYRFVIPSQLAYGDRGAGGAIGPGETLIFEVELLEIK